MLETDVISDQGSAGQATLSQHAGRLRLLVRVMQMLEPAIMTKQ